MSPPPSPPPGAVDGEALAGLGTSPIVNLHVHYDRRVLEEPLAAALGSPVQWLFDRTQASGADGASWSRSRSPSGDEIGASVAELRDRYLPALERLLPSARGARCSTSPSRTSQGDVPCRARHRELRPGPRTAAPGVYLAGAWTDTGWPATMEGAVRSGLAAARAALADLAGRSGRLDGSQEARRRRNT